MCVCDKNVAFISQWLTSMSHCRGHLYSMAAQIQEQDDYSDSTAYKTLQRFYPMCHSCFDLLCRPPVCITHGPVSCLLLPVFCFCLTLFNLAPPTAWAAQVPAVLAGRCGGHRQGGGESGAPRGQLDGAGSGAAGTPGGRSVPGGMGGMGGTGAFEVL